MIWFCVRRNGVARRNGWLSDIDLRAVRDRVRASAEEVIEACIAHDFQAVAPGRSSEIFLHRARGLTGMEIRYREDALRLAPTRMIAANLGFGRALERFLWDHQLERNTFQSGGQLRAFRAHQFLLFHGIGSPVELFRGSTTVNPLPSPDEDRPADLANGIGRWMLANITADGKMPYKYWPSRGTESPADNAIRQFLATLSLARLAAYRNDAGLRSVERVHQLRILVDEPTGSTTAYTVRSKGTQCRRRESFNAPPHERRR